MQLDRAPELRERLASGEAELENLVWAARFGVLRAYLDLGGSMDFDGLRSTARADLEAHWSDPHDLRGCCSSTVVPMNGSTLHARYRTWGTYP